MPCCGGAACACKVTAGSGVTITGSGSAADPFVVSSTGIEVADNTTFNLTYAAGVLTVTYAATAKLDDLPDVQAPTPTNAQVLSWNTSLSKWVPAAPTTAASGSVQHNTSLTGDGSAGSVLSVLHDPVRGTITGTPGVGLSDDTMNQLVLHHVDTGARTGFWLTPDLNALSMLDTVPGRIDYWNGTTWAPVPGLEDVDEVGELLAVSGSYVPGGRTKRVIRQVDTTTDADGVFEILSAADLPGVAGVLTVQFQETGAIPYKAMVVPDVDRITGVAYRLDDGATYPTQAVTGTVVAVTY